MKVATVYMERSMAGAALQCESQNFSMFEQESEFLETSLRRGRASLGRRVSVDFDMCAVGMVSPLGQPIRKRTRILTNCRSLVEILRCKQCPRDHTHRQIKGQELGQSLGKWCRVYPEPLCEILASVYDRS